MQDGELVTETFYVYYPIKYKHILIVISYIYIYTGSYDCSYRYGLRGTRWRSWLRHCATSRKVAGSIPDGVIGIFH